jgi:hypothetical protein
LRWWDEPDLDDTTQSSRSPLRLHDSIRLSYNERVMPFDDSVERAIAKRDGDSAKPAGAAAVLVSFEGGASRDGYETRVEVELPVRLHDSPVDRRAFAEKFLRFSPVGTAAQVADYLRSQLDRRAAAVVAEHSVSELMDGAAIAEVAAELKSAAIKPLFAAGLELDGEPTVRLTSVDWQRRRAEEAAESARQAAAAREGELLRRFEDIRRQNPDVPAGALLMGLPKGERLDALRALLKAAGARQRSRIFAVAGDILCEIDDAADEVLPLQLAGGLGPLRSVCAVMRKGRPHLLVGARDGVYLLDPEVPETAESFDADVEGSPFGFSNLAYDDGSGIIYATHADIGLVSWQIDLGTRSVRSASDFKGDAPRQIDVQDGQVHVAAGCRLWRIGHDGGPQPVDGVGEEPVALMVGTERELLLVRPSGELSALGRNDMRMSPLSGRGDVVTVGTALPWLGESRLVLGDSFSTSLSQLGPHDDVRMSYASASGPFKSLAAAADVVAAVSADRYRLVCWRPWEEQSFADIYAMSRTRSRLADVTVM